MYQSISGETEIPLKLHGRKSWIYLGFCSEKKKCVNVFLESKRRIHNLTSLLFL